MPKAGKDAGQDERGVADRSGAEKNPGQADKGECRQLFGQAGNAFPIEPRAFEFPGDQNSEGMQKPQITKVQAAPCQIPEMKKVMNRLR